VCESPTSHARRTVPIICCSQHRAHKTSNLILSSLRNANPTLQSNYLCAILAIVPWLVATKANPAIKLFVLDPTAEVVGTFRASELRLGFGFDSVLLQKLCRLFASYREQVTTQSNGAKCTHCTTTVTGGSRPSLISLRTWNARERKR
jgi:hypothetical protein